MVLQTCESLSRDGWAKKRNAMFVSHMLILKRSLGYRKKLYKLIHV